jgi:hypothetical protein
MDGWLNKRALKSGRNWRRRFFVLQGSKLSYFKDESQKKKKGSMVLDAGCCVSVDSSTTKPNAFKLTWPDGTLLMLSCAADAEQEEWMRALQACITHVSSEELVNQQALDLPADNAHPTGGGRNSFQRLIRTGSKKIMTTVGSSIGTVGSSIGSVGSSIGSVSRSKEATHCFFAHPPWEPSALHERLIRALILLHSLALPIWALTFALLIYHQLDALGLLFFATTLVAYLPQLLTQFATDAFERAMGIPITMGHLAVWLDISHRYPRLSIAVENMHVPNPTSAYVNPSFVSIGKIDVVLELNLPLLVKGVLNLVTVAVSDMKVVLLICY